MIAELFGGPYDGQTSSVEDDIDAIFMPNLNSISSAKFVKYEKSGEKTMGNGTKICIYTWEGIKK